MAEANNDIENSYNFIDKSTPSNNVSNNREMHILFSDYTIKNMFKDPYLNSYRIHNTSTIILVEESVLWFKYTDILKFYFLNNYLHYTSEYINNIIKKYSKTLFEINNSYMFFNSYMDIYVNELGLLELLSRTNVLNHFYDSETQILINNIKLNYNYKLQSENNKRLYIHDKYKLNMLLKNNNDYIIYKYNNHLKIFVK